MTANPAHSVDKSEVLAIADAVTPNPGNFPTTLDIAHLPAGFMAFNWRHIVAPGKPAGAEDDVTVCPKGMPKESGESSCFHVVAVRGTSGVLTSSVVTGQRILGGRGFADHSWVAVYATSRLVGVGSAEIEGLLQGVSFG